ncbi:hypothetical protein [Flagellimonas sp. 2504JD4-2]
MIITDFNEKYLYNINSIVFGGNTTGNSILFGFIWNNPLLGWKSAHDFNIWISHSFCNKRCFKKKKKMNKVFWIAWLFVVFTPIYTISQDLKEIQIGSFIAKVPAELEKLNHEEKELKYALQGHIPDIVYQNENDEINVSYKATLVPMEENQFQILKINLERQFTGPESEILQSNIVSINGKKFVLTQVFLRSNKILMTNLVTTISGKMVMVIISHSTNRENYINENQAIMQSLRSR